MPRVALGVRPGRAEGPARPHGLPGLPVERPTVVGTGWSSVVVGQLPDTALAQGRDPGQLTRLLGALPKVSGDWGSGRLLTGTLFSAVLADDGRVAIGAVAPERLYAALAAR